MSTSPVFRLAYSKSPSNRAHKSSDTTRQLTPKTDISVGRVISMIVLCNYVVFIHSSKGTTVTFVNYCMDILTVPLIIITHQLITSSTLTHHGLILSEVSAGYTRSLLRFRAHLRFQMDWSFLDLALAYIASTMWWWVRVRWVSSSQMSQRQLHIPRYVYRLWYFNTLSFFF